MICQTNNLKECIKVNIENEVVIFETKCCGEKLSKHISMRELYTTSYLELRCPVCDKVYDFNQDKIDKTIKAMEEEFQEVV